MTGWSNIYDPEGYANPRWWQSLDEQPGTPEMPHWCEANHPRETVSWFEAMAFCYWLSERQGRTICLPTEWQWQQAACSGHSVFAYPWGADYKVGYANINETYDDIGSHNLGKKPRLSVFILKETPDKVSQT